MKVKIILTFIFTIGLLNIVTAQKNSVRFGLRGGFYFSRFQFDQTTSNGKPDGDDYLYGGIQVDIPLSKNLSLVTEGLYALSSVSLYDGNLYHDYMNHLLIPVMLKYNVGKFGLFAGPQAELLLKAEGDYIENFTIKHGDVKNSSYNKFGLSGVAGFEFVFKYRFGIDARYQHFFGDYRASNASTVLATEYGKIQMHGFQTGLFYRFGKKPIRENK
jgi:hypothetical protein